MIRAFQVIGACAVIVCCLARLAYDAPLSQRDVVYDGTPRLGRMAYMERWQEEVVYAIFIIICGSFVAYTLRTGGAAGRPTSEDEHDNI
jgi:hypothetical protein